MTYRDTCDACVARKFADEAKAKEDENKSKPKRKWLASAHAPTVRVFTLIGVVSGFVASICLVKVSLNVAFPTWSLHLFAVIFLLVGKSAIFEEWLSNYSWSQTWLIAAWAPIVFPFLGVKRLLKWIATGT